MLGHWTYFTIIFVPGVLGILGTWILGHDVIILKIRKILFIVALLTCYFVGIDILAIHFLHIWSFRAEDVIGIRLAGDYIEEWLLFILTQTFIVSWAFILKERKRAGKFLSK